MTLNIGQTGELCQANGPRKCPPGPDCTGTQPFIDDIGRRLFDDYVMMVLNFDMLKTYLIGMAARHGERMNAAMVTRLIYSFTKALEPDARFKDYALGLLAQSGCMDMMHLAVLIKNQSLKVFCSPQDPSDASRQSVVCRRRSAYE